MERQQLAMESIGTQISRPAGSPFEGTNVLSHAQRRSECFFFIDIHDYDPNTDDTFEYNQRTHEK